MAAKKKGADEKKPAVQTVCRNSRARHQYEVLETIEAGIVLVGTEVKSLRDRKMSIEEGFARIREGEVWLCDCEIAPYTHGNRLNHEPKRPRKLLLRRREIGRLAGRVADRGLTLIPLSVYFARGLAKVRLGLARGRKTIDKREAIKERDAKRDMDRVLSQRRREK